MLDAKDGSQIYSTKSTYLTGASGWYSGWNTVVISGYRDNDYSSHRTGVDPQTGNVRWDLHLGGEGFGSESWTQADGTMVEVSDTSANSYDLNSGTMKVAAVFPEEWKNDSVVVNASRVVRFDAKSGLLNCYAVNDVTKPLWSVTTDSAQPFFLSETQVLIQGPRGTVMLSLADGSITKELPDTIQAKMGSEVDGLVVAGDSIIQVL